MSKSTYTQLKAPAVPQKPPKGPKTRKGKGSRCKPNNKPRKK